MPVRGIREVMKFKNLTLRPNAGVAQAEEGEINSTLSSFKHRPGAERERVYWGQIRPS